jgi:hypothetical protein
VRARGCFRAKGKRSRDKSAGYAAGPLEMIFALLARRVMSTQLTLFE